MRCAICIAAVVMFATTSVSHAQFRVCNRSMSEEVYVAVGHSSESGGWEAEGWYTVPRGTCSTIVPRELNGRYYYLYAESHDTVWDGQDGEGSRDFCVREGDAFKVDE